MIYFIVGSLIGAPIGFWIASLLAAAGRTEKSRTEEKRNAECGMRNAESAEIGDNYAFRITNYELEREAGT